MGIADWATHPKKKAKAKARPKRAPVEETVRKAFDAGAKAASKGIASTGRTQTQTPVFPRAPATRSNPKGGGFVTPARNGDQTEQIVGSSRRAAEAENARARKAAHERKVKVKVKAKVAKQKKDSAFAQELLKTSPGLSPAQKRAQVQRRREAETKRTERGTRTIGPRPASTAVGPPVPEKIARRNDERQIKKETAAQKKVDDATIAQVGTFVRDTPPKTDLEQGAVRRLEQNTARKKEENEHRDRKVKARMTPRSKKTIDRLEKFGSARDAAEAQAIIDRMAKTGERSVSKQRADEVERAFKDAEEEERVKKERSKGSSFVGNAWRDVKDAVNVVPVAQQLAKAGGEAMGNVASRATTGKSKPTPTRNAIVEGFVETDPIIQTIKHGPKAGARAAIRHPLALAGDVSLVAPVVRGGASLTLAKGSVKRAQARTASARARPSVRLGDDAAVKRANREKGAPKDAKEQLRRDRDAAKPKVTIRREFVADSKGGVQRKTVKREAPARPVQARVVGTSRQYSKRVTVRAAQKGRENLQAARGIDSVRPTGKKARKLDEKHIDSATPRIKNIYQGDAALARSGEAIDRAEGTQHRVGRGDAEKLERGATPEVNILTQELFGHVNKTHGLTERAAVLRNQIDSGELRGLQERSIAEELRRAGEKDDAKIARESARLASLQVDNAEQILATVEKHAPDHAAHKAARRDIEVLDELLTTARETEARAEQRVIDQRHSPSSRDRLGRARRRVAEVEKEMAARHRVLADVEKRNPDLARAQAIVDHRGRYADELDADLINDGQLGEKNADIRVRQQVGAAQGIIRHDERSPTGWIRTEDGNPVDSDWIETNIERPRGYVNYGRNQSSNEVLVGRQDVGKGFTGVGVHSTPHDRTLGVQHGERLDKVGQNRLAAEYLKHSIGHPEQGRLTRADATRIARQQTRKENVDWVPVKAGRVGGGQVIHAENVKDLAKLETGEDGYVVMPKALADRWEQQMAPTGRAEIGAQMGTRAFLRGVLGLNPGWIAGNLGDLALRTGNASGTRWASDFKLAEDVAAHGRHMNDAEARLMFDSLKGHVGANHKGMTRDWRDVMHSGKLANGMTEPGLRTSVGEALHRGGQARGVRQLRSAYNTLLDASLNTASVLEGRFVRAAQGKALRDVADELHINIAEQATLAKRILDDPAAAARFHQLTLDTIGNYLIEKPGTRRARTVGAPFLPWIKAATRWTLYSLPAEHPVRLAIYVKLANATEEQRRLIGQSDWITKDEAKAMRLPEPVDGFLGGGASVGPGWIAPLQHLFSPGAVQQMADDPAKYFGRSILPQIGTIGAKALGVTGSLPERAVDEATDAAGITEGEAEGNMAVDADSLAQAGMRTLLTYVAGSPKVVGLTGLRGPIQGGLGPSQTGEFDENGKLDPHRPSNWLGDQLGLGAQSILNKPPEVGVQGEHQFEEAPEAERWAVDNGDGTHTIQKSDIVKDGITGGFRYGHLDPADEIRESGIAPKERGQRALARVRAQGRGKSLKDLRTIKDEPIWGGAGPSLEELKTGSGAGFAPLTPAERKGVTAANPFPDTGDDAMRYPADAVLAGLKLGARASKQAKKDLLAGKVKAKAKKAKPEPGGIIGVSFAPGEEISGKIRDEVEYAHKKFGVTISDAFDRDRSAGHKSPGHNEFGDAVDFVGTPAQTDEVAKWAVKNGYTTYYDGSHGTTALSGHGPGHHIHVEFGSGPKNVRTGAPEPPEVRRGAPSLAPSSHKPVRALVTGDGTEKDKLRRQARQEAVHLNIDPDVFERQIQQESGFTNPGENSSHAAGIAQFIPGTAAAVGLKDRQNVTQSLKAGAKLMRQLLDQYDGNYARALSAYNSGRPDAYKDPSFADGQTYNYVKIILGGHTPAPAGSSSVPPDPLGGSSTPMDSAGSAPSGGPGAPRGGSPTTGAGSAPAGSQEALRAAAASEDPDTRSEALSQLLAQMNGGVVNADGSITLPRKAKARSGSKASGGNRSAVSSESKRAKARIRKGL